MTFISPSALEALRAASRAACPEEACGLLIGLPGEILEARPCPNLAAQKKDSFVIDPVRHLRLQRAARVRGLIILGSFHSHPDGEAAPSEADTKGHPGGDFMQLICAIRPGKGVEMRLFAREPQQNGTTAPRLVEQPLHSRKAVA